VAEEESRVQPQVAEPAMEVDGRYNRFALDLVPHYQEESTQVPLISQSSLRGFVVRDDSGSPEGKHKRLKAIFEEEKSRIRKEVDKSPKRIGEDIDEISGSDVENAVTGDIIVTVGDSQKAKRKRNKKKQQSKTTVMKEVETPAPTGMDLGEIRRRYEELMEIKNGLKKEDEGGLNRVELEFWWLMQEVKKLKGKSVE